MKNILLIKAERLTISTLLVSPPLGLLYIAAIAEKFPNYQAHILDLRVFKPRKVRDALLDALKLNPVIVGFNCTSDQINVLNDVARFLRKYLPKTPFLLGGPLATSDPESVLTYTPIDICFLGEGERSFEEFLQRFENKQEWKDIAGIAFKEGEQIIINKRAEPIQNLDTLPLIPWHKINLKTYSHFINQSAFIHYYTPIFSSRGCPYGCIFCHNMFGKQFRAMSKDRVLQEVEILYNQYKVRRIEFTEDIFNLDRNRAMEILRALPQHFPGIKVSFPNGLRADLLDEEMIEAMANSGCYNIAIAIESGSPRLQKFIGKNLNLNKAAEAAHLIRKYKIHLKGFFMVGFPTETIDEVMETYRFAVEHPFNYRLFFRLTPFKGTDVYDRFVKEEYKSISMEDLNYITLDRTFCQVPEEILREIEHKIFLKNVSKFSNIPLILRHIKLTFWMMNPFRRLYDSIFNFQNFRTSHRIATRETLRKGYELNK